MVACKYWLGLKLHFTTRKYDIFEHRGNIKGFTEEIYLARKDMKQFERLAKRYDEKVFEYFIANLVVGNKNIWDTSGIDSHDVYFNWLARKGASEYHLKKDLSHNGVMSKGDLVKMLPMDDGKMPILFDRFCSGNITPETICMIDACIPFLDHWDMEMRESLWTNGALMLCKYRPFVKPSESIHKILVAHGLTL